MIEIGKKQPLMVVNKTEFGVYLGNEQEKVLLPGKYVDEDVETGDSLTVFVYRDSKDRLIATTLEPLITLGEVRVLKVKQNNKIGSFLDWGLEKDILLPFKEQTSKVREGQSYLVRMYEDRSKRLCVSMKVYAYLETQSPYKAGDAVSGTVFEFNQNLGAFVAVDNRYSALIPMKEIHSRINVGETVEARVANVREDGKLNLSLQKPIREQINNDSEMVYNIIESYGGTLPFNDKADKEVIEKEFGLSKNAFKRAVGHLLKEGKIRITEKNIIIK